MSRKGILKYIGENAESMMKEINIINKLNEFKRVALPVLVILLFLIGAYLTSKTPSKALLPEGFENAESDAYQTRKLRNGFGTKTTADTEEGFENKPTMGGAMTMPPNVPGSGSSAASMTNSDKKMGPPKFETVNRNRCPNILIQHGSEIFLYNSKVEKVPGVNPIRFKNLEDYTEFMEWLQGRGIRCPVLFLQFSYDTQGKAVYKFRPSPMDLQGGLSPNVPYSPAPASLVKMMDASRDNPPFNNKMYDGYDPMNFNIGDYTMHDEVFTAKERNMLFSDNPMDSNWGGINYSRSVVGSGAYADRTRSDSLPMYVPQKYFKNTYTKTASTPTASSSTSRTTSAPTSTTTSAPTSAPTTTTTSAPTTTTTTTSAPTSTTTSAPMPTSTTPSSAINTALATTTSTSSTTSSTYTAPTASSTPTSTYTSTSTPTTTSTTSTTPSYTSSSTTTSGSGYVAPYVPPANPLPAPTDSSSTSSYTYIPPTNVQSTPTPTTDTNAQPATPPSGYTYGPDPNAPEMTNLCPGPYCPYNG